MIKKVLITIIGALISSASASNITIFNTILNQFEQKEMGNNEDSIKPVCGNLWKSPSNSRCNLVQWNSLSLNWQIKDLKNSMTYMKAKGYLISNHTQIIFNITKRWIPYFEKKTTEILSKESSSLICQLAAYKWFALNKESSPEDFYFKSYEPSARKCTDYLAKIRGCFLCSICDNHITNDTIFYPNGTSTSKGYALLKEKSCNYFLSECIDYIENKKHAINRLNLEFVLSLCDSNGVFIARDEKKSWKKVMPSKILEDQKRIEHCRSHLSNPIKYNGTEDTKKDEFPIFKRNSLACKELCEKYFSADVMIQDDLEQFHNMMYMHKILTQVILGNITDTSYFANTITRLEQPQSLVKYIDFKFENSFMPDVDESGVILKGKIAINLFEMYYSISGMTNFPVTEFVKFKEVVFIGIVGFVLGWVLVR